MSKWDVIIKQARECHTKEAWGNLFAQHRDELATSHTSRPLADLFKILSHDPQCLQYSPEIWATLLSGCLSSWNLELGRTIAQFTEKVASARIAIPAAEIYMESGSPAYARKIASRALRLSNLEPWENLQLHMILCNSYVEEGKHAMALRLLKRMEADLASADLDPKNLADTVINMARAQFFLGRYLDAAKTFYRSYQLYLELGDWEAAAKGLFNTAACHHNSGDQNQPKAFELVAECRRLSEQHQLQGPLSHCYAFYGTDDYQHGNFAGAAEHYRKALDHLPLSEKSFRRLHIMSMLAFTYLRTGRWQLANKFGKQTLDLATLDESERFRSRYLNLHAELYWQDGDVEASQTLLEEATRQLFSHGVHTLEELSTLSRYYLQSAMLNRAETSTKVKIADDLQHNTVSWLEYLVGLSQIYLTQRRFAEAYQAAEECYKKATDYGAKYYRCLGLLNLIQTLLAQGAPAASIEPFKRDLEIATSRIVETPLRLQVDLVHAALAYRQGNFDECKRNLNNASKQKRVTFVDRLVLQSWHATLEGHSPKLTTIWQEDLVARATWVYFGPQLEALDEHTFRLSEHYLISLDRHPVLAKMLRYLMTKNNFSASAADLQEEVWSQSLSLQGWQQKIRNTVMRMRDCFPYTMAPLILHSDNQIRLFSEAIDIQPLANKNVRPEAEILRLLQEGPMSSVQLANRINVSQATTKRILKKLSDADRVTVAKIGRKVFYHVGDSGRSTHH